MLKKNSIIFSFFLFLVVINIFVWTKFYELNQPEHLGVVFFDVGQGDSILIKTHLNHYILIDGGEDSLILEKLNKEIPFWVRDIDLIILTHAHSDHLGGLIHVMERYNVGNVLWNGVNPGTILSDRWEKIIKENNCNIKISQSGQRIKVGNFAMDILHPFNDVRKESFDDLNLSSIVLKISYLNNSFLLMGDAHQEIEQELIEMEDYCKDKMGEIKCRGMELDSDVLKIGHHGSKTSTSKNFLENVSPSIAVISVGEDNRYNHPHSETLELLEKYDIKIARTDKDGDIKITINN
jgi:competence protein ComEC